MDFKDCRGMKVVFVPHCALNQNARLANCAERPAGVPELVSGLMERGIGIVQMPCTELMVLGLAREDVQIRQSLDSPDARAALRRMARDLVRQIREYQSCGVKVLGILGKDGSPACGVERTHFDDDFGPGMGVFVEELDAELKEQGIELPIAGTLDAEPADALAAVDAWDAQD
jgi:predicted secreted protein